MSRWFRHYAGMMRDDKLVRIAIKTGQPIERVVWVWGAILESAAEIDNDGKFDVDGAEVAYFLRTDQANVDAVLHGLAAAGHLVAGCVTKWGARQFISDRPGMRQAAYRERKKAGISGLGHTEKDAGNVTVTLPLRNSNAPETEQNRTETDITEAKATVIARRALSIPKGWEPILTERARSIVDGWPPGMFDDELAKFRDHASDKGRTSKDWQAGFRTWIANADKWSKQNGKNIRAGDRGGPDKRTGFERALDRRIGVGI